MYTQQEFLDAYADKKVTLVVNTGIYRNEVESKLPKSYRTATVLADGVSMLLLIMALPMYLVFGWLFAALSVAASLGAFFFFRKLNYRVFVRAQVKENEEFFNYCRDNAIIRIVEKI